MSKTRNELCKELSDILLNFRKDELSFNIDAQHVHNWVSQFSDEYIDVILSEMIFVFRKWYFSVNRIKEDFLDELITFLQRKYKYDSINDFISDTVFLNVQDVGESQKMLLQLLKEMLYEQYRVEIKIGSKNLNVNHYVYIDDGLYTGSRARKDIETVLHSLPENSTLDVFYLVVGTSGFYYTFDKEKSTADANKIVLSFYRAYPLYNRHTPLEIEIKETSETETYEPYQSCLWPSIDLKRDEKIASFGNALGLNRNQENHLYRKGRWISDRGIFTSVHNRYVVEKEFLLKGIEIIEGISDNKGMYPLGYNLWKSFGFGSICATEFNISNTCPLVLWWDIEWTPLLPRRINSEEIPETIDFYDETIKIVDQYNMCPDCGEYFGIEADGGNGFCINCAWKH